MFGGPEVQRLCHQKDPEVSMAELCWSGRSLWVRQKRDFQDWGFYHECSGKQRESGSSLQIGEVTLAALRSLD